MKKFDKEALKKAFDIPNPQHKEKFLDQLNIKKNNPKRHIPIFMRFASMAAFAAIMVNIVTNLSLTADFPDQFTSDKTIIPTNSSSVTTEETPTATTAATVGDDQILIQTTVSTAESEIITATAAYEAPAETTAVEFSESPPTTIAAVPPNTAETHTATTMVKTSSTKLTQQTTPTKTTMQSTQSKPNPVTTTTNRPVTTTPKTTKTSPPTTASHDNNIQTTFNPPPISITKTTTVDSAIWTTATATTPSVDCPSEDNDFTVRPTTVYAPSDMIIDKYKFDSEHDLTFEDDRPTNSTDTSLDITTEKLFNGSAFIFRGIIEEKIYTDISGQPYTIENIVITDIPKSQNKFYSENDKISIYVPGGYIPVHTYAEANNVTCDYPDNYMIYSDGGNKSTQNVGEEYFFFLNYGTDDMPYGALKLMTNNDISVFRIDGYDLISLGNSDLTFPFIGRLP